MSADEIQSLFDEAKAEDARELRAEQARIESKRIAAWPTWARQDLWSQAEFAEICCGRVPGEPNRTDAEQAAFNWAKEVISRGTLSGSLQFVAREDADTAARMYGTARHYVPAIAAEWAATRFDAFPAALLDVIRSHVAATRKLVTPAAQSNGVTKPAKLRSDREQNLLRVIAGLWALSELPAEHNTTADKLSALFDSWGWDGPAKQTIADSFLKEAANLPGAIIRKSD